MSIFYGIDLRLKIKRHALFLWFDSH